MKTNKIGKIVAGIVLAGSLTGCYHEDYLTYNADFTGIYFRDSTVSYSFGVAALEIREHTINVPVRIMGVPSAEVRRFAFEIIPDSTDANTLDGMQYRLGTPQIPADSINGFIPVIVLRDGLNGNYENGFTRYKLGLKLVADKVFTPTLNESSQRCVITFDNAIEQPEWLDFQGNKVWRESELGVWHPLKLIKMVEYFHALEAIQPETYDKMVDLYGENLEHIPYGDPYQYKTTINKYVYKPMYDYFSDAAKRLEILELYPDFPFDFPNPFPDATE